MVSAKRGSDIGRELWEEDLQEFTEQSFQNQFLFFREIRIMPSYEGRKPRRFTIKAARSGRFFLVRSIQIRILLSFARCKSILSQKRFA